MQKRNVETNRTKKKTIAAKRKLYYSNGNEWAIITAIVSVKRA